MAKKIYMNKHQCPIYESGPPQRLIRPKSCKAGWNRSARRNYDLKKVNFDMRKDLDYQSPKWEKEKKRIYNF